MVALDFPDAPTDGQDFGVWKWSDTTGSWRWNVVPSPYEFEYVVVAGGGGCGGWSGAAGGAGGYRSNVAGESSGGGAGAEAPLSLLAGTYTVAVGAGGPRDAQGGDSQFYTITSAGGGSSATSVHDGGSGAGSQAGQSTFGNGTPEQGFDGGSGASSGGGGGGGASQAGGNASTNTGGNGGNGVQTSISGTPVYYAGGGGGGGGVTGGTGGLGGGTNGTSNETPSTSAEANTGGGAGSSWLAGNLVNGGSGIVILKYPNAASLSIPAGLTAETDSVSVPGYKITTFTAGTGTITLA